MALVSTPLDAPALFVRDGDRLHPTVLTQGPWDPGAQHGGPVCAALAYLVEAVPTLVPMQVSRFTFDLIRPAPLTALRAHTRVRREGKRLQLVEAVLCDGEVEVAHAEAMRVRIVDIGEVLEHPDRPRHTVPPSTGNGRPVAAASLSKIGFLRAIEIERVGDEATRRAVATTWFRARVPLVEGEATTPLQRLALFSDFTSSTAQYLDHKAYSAINADVSLQVLREPVGEWICVEGTTDAGGTGVGHSRASLYDRSGFVASASTSQLIDRRPAPFA